MIKCFKCGEEFKSPTDNDSFRQLFADFGSQGVKQAEKTGSVYLARKAGWADERGVVWACPGCLSGRGETKQVDPEGT